MAREEKNPYRILLASPVSKPVMLYTEKGREGGEGDGEEGFVFCSERTGFTTLQTADHTNREGVKNFSKQGALQLNQSSPQCARLLANSAMACTCCSRWCSPFLSDVRTGHKGEDPCGIQDFFLLCNS